MKALAACMLLASAGSGFAATTWTPGLGCTDNAQCTTTAATSTSSAVAGKVDGGAASAVTVTASAYAVSNTAGSAFTQASLYEYSTNHLGVVSSGENPNGVPEHAMDNAGATELISLKFSSALVALNNVTTAYANGDSDMSLLAYTANGGAAPTNYSIAGQKIGDLLTSGWTLVATIDGNDASGGASYGGLNARGVTSSWWLVSAYNAGYGNSSLSGGNDYMKLLSVAGDVKSNNVPEPGSLALIGVGLFAALRARRRTAKTA
jgi:hypothetical protein